MLKCKSFVGATLVGTLVLAMLGCFGGNGKRTSRDGHPSLMVGPSSLSIPAGGGGAVVVTTSRPLPHAIDYQGALALSLDGAPAGVTGSGTIASDRSTGTLSLWVDASVSPQTVQNLRVKATGGRLVVETGFQLTIAPPLPPGEIRADQVQAGGRAQQGGTLANTPIIQEPVAATPATTPAQVEAVRHGFDPSATPH